MTASCVLLVLAVLLSSLMAKPMTYLEGNGQDGINNDFLQYLLRQHGNGNQYQGVNNEVDRSIDNDVHLPGNCFLDPDCCKPIDIPFCCHGLPPLYRRDPIFGRCCRCGEPCPFIG